MTTLTRLAAKWARQAADENPDGNPHDLAAEGAERALWAAATDPRIIAELQIAVLNEGVVR